VGKHTDTLIEQLVTNTEGKTNCKQFNSDDWGGYERVLPPEIKYYPLEVDRYSIADK